MNFIPKKLFFFLFFKNKKKKFFKTEFNKRMNDCLKKQKKKISFLSLFVIGYRLKQNSFQFLFIYSLWHFNNTTYSLLINTTMTPKTLKSTWGKIQSTKENLVYCLLFVKYDYIVHLILDCPFFHLLVTSMYVCTYLYTYSFVYICRGV